MVGKFTLGEYGVNLSVTHDMHGDWWDALASLSSWDEVVVVDCWSWDHLPTTQRARIR